MNIVFHLFPWLILFVAEQWLFLGSLEFSEKSPQGREASQNDAAQYFAFWLHRSASLRVDVLDWWSKPRLPHTVGVYYKMIQDDLGLTHFPNSAHDLLLIFLWRNHMLYHPLPKTLFFGKTFYINRWFMKCFLKSVDISRPQSDESTPPTPLFRRIMPRGRWNTKV